MGEERERNSLLDIISTPVDSRPAQKISAPKDNIQDRTLLPVQENMVTATATSTQVYKTDQMTVLLQRALVLTLKARDYSLR